MKHDNQKSVTDSDRRSIVATALAAGTFFGLANLACSAASNGSEANTGSDETGGGTGSPESAHVTGKDANVALLNALLAAEYQALAAYDAGISLIETAAKNDPLLDLAPRLSEVAESISGHHRSHAEALARAIVELEGTPVDEAEARARFVPPKLLLEYPTILNTLRFAAAAERAATIAYNQMVEQLEAAQLRFLAGAIGGDEGEHFIVLTALVVGLAAPGPALDSSTTDKLIPTAFISSVDTEPGLKDEVPDYFD